MGCGSSVLAEPPISVSDRHYPQETTDFQSLEGRCPIKVSNNEPTYKIELEVVHQRTNGNDSIEVWKSGKPSSASHHQAVCVSETKEQHVAKALDAKTTRLQPMPFAIMRNGHEVLRGGLRDCATALEAGNIPMFLENWANFRRWNNLRSQMEEGVQGSGRGFFSVLDEHFRGLGSQLLAAHKELEELELAVELAAAIWKGRILGEEGMWQPGKDLEKKLEPLVEALNLYATAIQVHLKVEEDIMMPRVMKMSKCGHNMKRIMAEDLLACVKDEDMPFFLGYAMRILESHSQGEPRACVFVHAVCAVATEAQWTGWQSYLQVGASATLWDEVVKTCGF